MPYLPAPKTNISENSKRSKISDRVWFVRLYGKIIHERQRVDYHPYRRTNHTLTSLLHLYASAPCTLEIFGVKLLNIYVRAIIEQ